MKNAPSELAPIDLARLATVTGGRLFGGGMLGGGGLFGWRQQQMAGCPGGNCGGAAAPAPASGG